jgi:hypothetical protein
MIKSNSWNVQGIFPSTLCADQLQAHLASYPMDPRRKVDEASPPSAKVDIWSSTPPYVLTRCSA